MKQLKIHLHSASDVITNSSTSIYTNSRGEKEVKEAIQEMLDFFECTVDIDTLFLFRVVPEDTCYMKEILIDDSPLIIDMVEEIILKKNKGEDLLVWQDDLALKANVEDSDEKLKAVEQFVEESEEEVLFDIWESVRGSWHEDEMNMDSVMIIRNIATGKTLDFTNAILKTLKIEEEYN